jgi:hypothetical protein
LIKFSIIFLICFSSLSAQVKIDGFVRNGKGTPIESASIVIKNTFGDILTYGYSNEKGFFSLENNLKNNIEYILLVNSLGFE